MQTVFDWASVAVFAALVVIFMQRSIGPRPASDRMLNYVPPAVGCALGNYAGNEGYGVVGFIILALVVVYIIRVIKPNAKA